jgi:hypothetical protein
MIVVEDTTIRPVSSPVSHRMAVLGDLVALDEEYTIQELKALVGANSLLDCLISHESSWRANVYGDNGRAFGLLQFHRPTFNMFSKKYNLTLDYYKPIDQIILASIILNDNINYIYHWSTWKFCK